MKYLVETTGQFILHDAAHGQVIEGHRPSVVTMTDWLNARLGHGQLRIVLPDLPDTATDEEFVGYWKEAGGNKEFAVASYRSSFDTETPAPRKRASK